MSLKQNPKLRRLTYQQLLSANQRQVEIIEDYRHQTDILAQELRTQKELFDKLTARRADHQRILNSMGQAIEANARALDAVARMIGGPGF